MATPGGHKSETGRIRFRGVRFQTPNSVSFSGLTEFRGANSVSSPQPIICVPKRTHRVFRRTHRVRRRTQWVLSSETVLSKQYSARFLTNSCHKKISLNGFWAWRPESLNVLALWDILMVGLTEGLSRGWSGGKRQEAVNSRVWQPCLVPQLPTESCLKFREYLYGSCHRREI